jgi:AcrR family transcriptional regulator
VPKRLADGAEHQMARPREFDETAALEAAIACFWSRGYEATSVRDLAENMGLSAPSLYNAYGDKHALFVKALERYLDHSMLGSASSGWKIHSPRSRPSANSSEKSSTIR